MPWVLCTALTAAWISQLAGAAESAGQRAVAWTTQSAPFHGRLVEVTSDGSVVFQTEKGRRSVPPNQLIRWGAAVGSAQRSQILLADGGTLVADAIDIDETSLALAGQVWRETTIARSAVRAILFHVPTDPLERDRLVDQLDFGKSSEDRLILENGDQLEGRLAIPFRPEAGELLPTTLRWQVSGRAEPIAIPVERIVALTFHAVRSAAPTVESRWVVSLRDGSRIVVQQIVRKDAQLDIRSSGTVHLMTEPVGKHASSPWDQVVAIRSLTANVIYLSDLDPIGYKQIPYLDIQWPYHRDRNVLGGHLRHDKFLFEKGIGMHSSARLAYDVNPHYRWLDAELAIDRCAGEAGSVIFRVYRQGADGKWVLAYESPVIRGGEALQPMHIDLRQANRIALIVDFADRADQWDHANWLNARLVP